TVHGGPSPQIPAFLLWQMRGLRRTPPLSPRPRARRASGGRGRQGNEQGQGGAGERGGRRGGGRKNSSEPLRARTQPLDAGGRAKMSDEPLAREHEPIERVRARLEALAVC